MRYTSLLLLSFCLLVLCSTQKVHALETVAPTVLKIQPVLEDFSVQPGELITKNITITNLSLTSLPITAYVRSFEVVDDDGNNNYPNDQSASSVQHWFSIDPANFILQPQESRKITVTITVQKNSSPGGHYATLFFQSLVPQVSNDQSSVSISGRIGALYFVTVSGNITTKASLSNFFTPKFIQSGPVTFTSEFTNQGTVHVRPQSILIVRNWHGKIIYSSQESGKAILPGTVRRIAFTWPSSWLFGMYSAQILSQITPNTQPQERLIHFFAFPLVPLVVLLSSSVCMCTIVVKRKIRIKKAFLALLQR